jgi:hypothetical protein
MLKFRLEVSGVAPLMMHSARLSGPTNEVAVALKKLTGKRNKTLDDHRAVSRLEHAGGLYLDDEVGPYLPGDNLWRALYDAAKKRKMGPMVKEGVIITSVVNPLGYRGPRDAAGLWADPAHVFSVSAKVGTARVMRARPIFPDWAVEAEGVLDEAILDPAQLGSIADVAGMVVGLGDWRPRYGRFTAAVELL